jgi:hypothetical protein
MTQEAIDQRAAHQIKSARYQQTSQEALGKWRMGLLVLLVLTLILNGWSLMRFPAPFVDEVWLASRAWGFIQTGRAFGPLDVGVIDRFEGYWTFYPWLPVWIQSLTLRFSAQPALFPVRVVSLFFGVLLLVAVYFIAKRLYGIGTGLLAAILVSASGPFLYSAHLARYDIMTAALGFIAIALYLNNHRGRAWPGLVAGLCIGLGFEIHPHAVFYGPAILALYFLHHRWSMFRRRDLWAFFVGLGLGFVFYVLLHIAPYPQTYLALNQIVFTTSHTPPIFTLDPHVILQAIGDMAKFLLGMDLLMVPIIAWAVVALAKRRSEADRTLLVLAATLIVGATLLFRIKAAFYAILFSPAIQLLVAGFLAQTLQRPWRSRIQKYAGVSISLGVCIGAITLNLASLRTDALKPFEEAQGYIDQVVQPGESIMGPQTYWLGLYDHSYYSWESLIDYQSYAPGSTIEDALRELRPDILIIDRHLAVFISDKPGQSGYGRYLHLPKSELEAFLDRYATLVGQLDIDYYGPIRIYRITWDEERPKE